VNAGQQRGDRRLRLARTTRELRVRRQGSRVQALVIRDRAKKM